MSIYAIINRNGKTVDEFKSDDDFDDVDAMNILDSWSENNLGKYTLLKDGEFYISQERLEAL